MPNIIFWAVMSCALLADPSILTRLQNKILPFTGLLYTQGFCTNRAFVYCLLFENVHGHSQGFFTKAFDVHLVLRMGNAVICSCMARQSSDSGESAKSIISWKQQEGKSPCWTWRGWGWSLRLVVISISYHEASLMIP